MPTPTSPYIRLDSSLPSSQWPVAPAAARQVLWCQSPRQGATLHEGDRVVRTWDDPLTALAWMAQSIREAPAGCRWVGFLSYDLGRLLEEIPTLAQDDLSIPLFAFALLDPTGKPPTPSPTPAHPADHPSPLRSNFADKTYLSAVARAIEYIRAGDIFQVNLSQRLSVPCAPSPAAIYDRLLAASPAYYGGLLDFGDFALVCNSPELFFHITPDRRIVTRPIKGTRPRAPGMDVALRDSIKDQAELHMIVDLERNDLGRVSEIGSVRVTEPRAIEAHPTVYHGVATVEGVLRRDVDFVSVLRAVFPGGSITGAPKIRAMQIIEELEPHRRGAYCGAIGQLLPDGSAIFNIAIRTMTLRGGVAYVPVGGGIVADSDPQAEYDETLVKARAMLAALGVEAASLG